MYKWNYTFEEIRKGCISIYSDSEPTKEQFIEEVINGKPTYYDKDWANIKLFEKVEEDN